MMTKKEVRSMMSKLKRECPMPEKLRKSEIVFAKLVETTQFRHSKNILLYWSMSDEVHTHEFVARVAQQRNVYLPVVDGENLRIRRFTGLEGLVDGESFAIPEPGLDAEEVDIRQIDLAIIPGVAFDLNGGRLGRGKGFYDKLLAHADENLQKIGICFDFQLMDQVPTDPNDILMTSVIYG